MRFCLTASAFVLLVSTACAGDLCLTRNGRSDYRIPVPNDASLSQKHAADELQSFLAQISGARLPIAKEDKSAPEHTIVLGTRTDLGDEVFSIKVAGDNLLISCGQLRGATYGIYTFLEDVFGGHWYSSKVSCIPKKPSIILTDLDILQKPSFEYREPDYAVADDPDWSARNKRNSAGARLDEARGG